MVTQAMCRHIGEVLSAPDAEGAMRARIGALGDGISEAQAAELLRLVREYVDRAPELLEACAGAAQGAGVAAEAAPILQAAAQYFLEPQDFLPDGLGLYGLLDDAYLVHSFVAGVSALYRQYAGVPLLPVDLGPMNAVARMVIGEPLASRLDQAVAATLQQVQQQVQALSQQGQSLQFSRTGGPGAWGGTWEDEMARMGAECGISINYW